MKKLNFRTGPLSIPLMICTAISLNSCSKTKDDLSESPTIPTTNEYFKGIIVLDKKDGFGQKSVITLNLTGDAVKREVNESANKISYGMIYKMDEDSVLYYYTKEMKTSHVAIPKKDFEDWINFLEEPTYKLKEYGSISSSLIAPFGIIFMPFDNYAENISLSTIDFDLKKYGMAKSQTFLLGNRMLCNVGYSEDIKIRPEILTLLEHRQPKTIPSIALTVFYSSPKSPGNKSITEEIGETMQKVSAKMEDQLNLNKVSSTNKVSIDLPPNSKRVKLQQLNGIINPPIPADENKRRRHHHDFF